MIAINNQIPRTAAAVNPAIPITETPKNIDGAYELITMAEPMIKTATMMEEEILFLV